MKRTHYLIEFWTPEQEDLREPDALGDPFRAILARYIDAGKVTSWRIERDNGVDKTGGGFE